MSPKAFTTVADLGWLQPHSVEISTCIANRLPGDEGVQPHAILVEVTGSTQMSFEAT